MKPAHAPQARAGSDAGFFPRTDWHGWGKLTRAVPVAAETLVAHSRQEWRAWLRKHQGSSSGVWLVFYKKHAAMKSLPYEEAVREALCFGWIDSLVKRLDEDRYAQKFTPRKPSSKWSDTNRARWRELEAAGLLTAAGRAAGPTDNAYAPLPAIPALPGYIASAIKKDAGAWSFFRELPPGERRRFVVWIHMAKRPETRDKRIRESIDLLASRRRLGLK